MKKLLTVLFTLLFVLGIASEKINADEYTYSIYFDGGLYGTITGDDGNEITVIKDIPAGSKFYCNGNDISIVLNDASRTQLSYTVGIKDEEDYSKYYFKGFHLTGKVDEIGTSNYTINEDLLLAASFGVAGSLTEYQVYYFNEDGEELLPMDVMYANVGDSPIVGSRYVAGYLPLVSMMQSTPLQKGVIQKFYFVYRWYGEDDVYVPLEPIIEYIYPRRTEENDDGVVEEIIEYVYEPAPEPVQNPAVQEEEPIEENKTILETIADALAPLTNWVNEQIERNPILGYSIVLLLIAALVLFFAFLIFLLIIFIKRKKKDKDKERPQTA